jgi:hypothetical protein
MEAVMLYTLGVFTVVVSVVFGGGQTLAPSAADSGEVIATIRVAHPVLANGAPLPTGTYQVRLTNERPKPAPGQSPDAARWIALVAHDTVVAREVAIVIQAEDIAAVAKSSPPGPGEVRVELLRGDEFLRIWINHLGTHYLIHLPVNRSLTTRRSS